MNVLSRNAPSELTTTTNALLSIKTPTMRSIINRNHSIVCTLVHWIIHSKILPYGRYYCSTRVNSFTIFMLSLFYCRQNLCQVNRQFFRRSSWWSRYIWIIVHLTLSKHHSLTQVGYGNCRTCCNILCVYCLKAPYHTFLEC